MKYLLIVPLLAHAITSSAYTISTPPYSEAWWTGAYYSFPVDITMSPSDCIPTSSENKNINKITFHYTTYNENMQSTGTTNSSKALPIPIPDTLIFGCSGDQSFYDNNINGKYISYNNVPASTRYFKLVKVAWGFLEGGSLTRNISAQLSPIPPLPSNCDMTLSDNNINLGEMSNSANSTSETRSVQLNLLCGAEVSLSSPRALNVSAGSINSPLSTCLKFNIMYDDKPVRAELPSGTTTYRIRSPGVAIKVQASNNCIIPTLGVHTISISLIASLP